MKASPIALLLALPGLLLSSLASAHSGEYSHNLLNWLGHLFSQPDHLLALAGFTVLLAAIAGVKRGLKKRPARLSSQINLKKP